MHAVTMHARTLERVGCTSSCSAAASHPFVRHGSLPLPTDAHYDSWPRAEPCIPEQRLSLYVRGGNRRPLWACEELGGVYRRSSCS